MTAPKPDCGAKPEHPGRLATEAASRQWRTDANAYLECFKKFAMDQRALAQQQQDAANAVIDEYNAAVKEMQAAADAARRQVMPPPAAIRHRPRPMPIASAALANRHAPPPSRRARSRWRCSTASTSTTRCSANARARRKRHFEAGNWLAIQHVARDRIDFYDRRVIETAERVAREFRTAGLDGAGSDSLWEQVKLHYIGLLIDHKQPECAETFFNSVSVKILHRAYFHNRFIFVRPAISTEHIDAEPPSYTATTRCSRACATR